MDALYVFIGGGIGSLLRYVLTLIIPRFKTDSFPWATLAANIASAIIVSIILTFVLKQYTLNKELKLLLVVGVCGGLSTFSTFSMELVELIQNKSFQNASLYFALNTLLCPLIIFIISRNEL